MIDAVRDPVFVLDAAGTIEMWNRCSEVLHGFAGAELRGRPIRMLYPTDDPTVSSIDTVLAEARARGSAIEVERWQLRKDGSRFAAHVTVRHTPPREGSPEHYVTVSRDLTERRRANDQRFQEDTKFRALVENARDYAIFMLDTTGHVASWNEGAQRIKGYTAHDIIGRHFSKFLPEEDVRTGKCERELATALAEGRFEEEGWRLRKDGSRFWANVVIAPLRDDQGNHIGFSKITRDLTERRAAELDRLDLVRAQEALRLRDEFLSVASHELRTPLVALQLQLESVDLDNAALEPKLAAKISRARRNAIRLADLISTLLDVSRIAEGRLTLAIRRIDLGELVREVVDRLEESAALTKNVVVVSGEAHVFAFCDPLRMSQVLSNLLANAFKYAAGTPIDVHLEREDHLAVLTVEDRGPGIPDHQLERVFDRFERAASVRNYPGMGLGLYVAREIVVAHGGSIAARNRDGGGTTIEIRLPITKDPMP